MDEVAALRNVTIFAHLPDRVLREVLRVCTRRRFKRREALLREGEPGETMYVVLRGRLEITREDRNQETVHLATRGPGDALGEMTLLDGGTRSATATASEPGEALSLSRQAFFHLLRQSPELALEMLAGLSRRLREADDARTARPTLRDRLNEFLLAHAQEMSNGDRAVIGFTGTEIARRIRATRESVSRELSKMRREGAVRKKGRAILLTDAFGG
ncbi:MAG: Crp/Fnr family transcriptional regulator [Fimbriimonadaceae bacterium]|nr:Crp/Fnr family transcriptional regulator [Fimbriimonadaceae bacterium]